MRIKTLVCGEQRLRSVPGSVFLICLLLFGLVLPVRELLFYGCCCLLISRVSVFRCKCLLATTVHGKLQGTTSLAVMLLRLGAPTRFATLFTIIRSVHLSKMK
ncbi:hypothetical protein ARMSODRAFT_621598 [Armillaria solidipes]|uniref:Uncharacterized protein n=1 Tax=Armillaria solidipes TaxID=1076256 RepID=A0A2H3ASS5_9AGAR|nr:hypothetical protein ARMSODRAFT_621598 [Armillaria solidipes]